MINFWKQLTFRFCLFKFMLALEKKYNINKYGRTRTVSQNFYTRSIETPWNCACAWCNYHATCLSSKQISRRERCKRISVTTRFIVGVSIFLLSKSYQVKQRHQVTFDPLIDTMIFWNLKPREELFIYF